MRSVALHLVAFTALAFIATTTAGARAGGTVNILVLKEHGIGSAAQAQPHIDSLVSVAASKNGWSSAKGKYVTKRSRAEKYINATKPSYGIMSLGAFLGLRKAHGLKVLGLAEVAGAGGRSYHLISKKASSLSGCKGHKLASNHADHPRFINKVVSGGDFTLDDFTLVSTKRPVQTIKKVARGDAHCALIDDAQLAEMAHVRDAGGLKSVWSSKTLPPMPVVAFSSAPSGERDKFKSSLGSICTGAGATSCKKVGIRQLKSTSDATYSSVMAAYGN